MTVDARRLMIDRRWLFWGLGALLAGWLVVLLGQQWLNRHRYEGILLQADEPVADFVLDSTRGEPLRLSDLRGQYVLLFFGYTSCPDICPLTMAELAQTKRLLADQADKVQVVLVTVDPANDTVERMSAYLRLFDDSFLGMTGSPEALGAVASQFGIYFAKSQQSTSGGVDHTSSVAVIDPAGYLRLIFAPSTPSSLMAADLKALMR
jgi:protein SCO1/2